MVVPVRYRQAKETVLANFDFSDLASGTGYVTYYFYKDLEGNTILSETANYGSGTKTQVNGDGEKNYDSSTFNLPRTVRGTGIIDSIVFPSKSL